MEIGKYKCSYVNGVFFVTFKLRVKKRFMGISYWKVVYRGEGFDMLVHKGRIEELGLEWLEGKYRRIISGYERLVNSDEEWIKGHRANKIKKT